MGFLDTWGQSNVKYNSSAAMSNAVSIRLYRIILRQCRTDLYNRPGAASTRSSAAIVLPSKRNEGLFLLQPTLDATDNGSHELHPSGIPQAQWWHVLQFFQAQCYQRGETFRIHAPRRESASSDSDESSSSGSSSDDESDDDDDDCNEFYLEFLEPRALQKIAETKSSFSPIAKDIKVNSQSLLWCSPSTLQEAIRVSFRHAAHSSFKQPDWHDRALAAYRMVLEQASLWQHASVHSERSIRITAVPLCIASLAQQNRYGYAYRILVENVHDVVPTVIDDVSQLAVDSTVVAPPKVETSVQLLGRTWIIHTFWPPLARKFTSPDDGPIRVHAPIGACVGQQPILEAGSAFAYQSSAAGSSAGRMEGSLHFSSVPEKGNHPQLDDTDEATKQEFFEVPVAPFQLSSGSYDDK